MTDDKVLDTDAQKGEEYEGDTQKTLQSSLVKWMDQEVKERGVQQQRDAELDSNFRGIVEDARSMRKVIVWVALIVPLIPLLFLWLLIIGGVVAWWKCGAPSNEVLNAFKALSAPMTAMVVGTFTSFILVYSTLVVTTQLKTTDDISRKKDISIMPGIMADAIKKVVPGDSQR